MLVFLIGYMGSGKSTIGYELSNIMNMSFIDLDNLIEQKESMSITQIFSQKGEDFFRKTESSILTNYNFNPNSIIATGGGTPCFFNNHDFMKSIGYSIYLKVSANEITDRLQLDKKRPLLFNNKLNLRDFINQQLDNREKHYQMSNYVIESDNILVAEVYKVIKRSTD